MDIVAGRVLKLVYDSIAREKEGITYNKEEHHALARKIAGESMVLLKNEKRCLSPWKPAKKLRL